MMQRTLVLIKPDGIIRSLVGKVIERFENKGLKLVAIKMLKVTPKLSKEHYSHHKDKPFYPGIEKYITSLPVVALVLEGVEAVEVVRTLVGVTNSRKAAPGTIRGDLSNSFSINIIHASDSLETAKAEIKRFFKDDELFNWERDEYYFYAGDEL